MYTFFRLILIALVIAPLYAASAIAKSAAPENCQSIPYDNGRLWKVMKDGRPPSYVFGTMHSNDPRILFMPGIIMQAFNGSRVLILETSLRDKTAAQSQAMMRKSAPYSLRQQIGPTLFGKLTGIVSRDYGIPPQILNSFQIWAAAAFLSQPPEQIKSNAKKPATLLDHELEKTGRRMNKQIVPLETMKEQLSIFSRMSKNLQLEYLELAIQEYPNLEEEVAALSDYYIDGKIGWIFCMMNEGLAKISDGLVRVMKDQLIIKRNKKMVSRMKHLVRKGQAFVAVGALHLPGEDGILSLLAADGYKIEKMY
ncbi:MAG: TraB/GumN family protein [Sneathiella sp.]